MALIKCPECGRENVSSMAEFCPGCGFNIKRHSKQISTEINSPKQEMKDINIPTPQKKSFNYPFLIYGVIAICCIIMSLLITLGTLISIDSSIGFSMDKLIGVALYFLFHLLITTIIVFVPALIYFISDDFKLAKEYRLFKLNINEYKKQMLDKQIKERQRWENFSEIEKEQIETIAQDVLLPQKPKFNRILFIYSLIILLAIIFRFFTIIAQLMLDTIQFIGLYIFSSLCGILLLNSIFVLIPLFIYYYHFYNKKINDYEFAQNYPDEYKMKVAINKFCKQK